jgi:hypothetical protein
MIQRFYTIMIYTNSLFLNKSGIKTSGFFLFMIYLGRYYSLTSFKNRKFPINKNFKRQNLRFKTL